MACGQHLEIYSGIHTTITWTWYQTPEEFSRITVQRYLVRTYSLALGRAYLVFCRLTERVSCWVLLFIFHLRWVIRHHDRSNSRWQGILLTLSTFQDEVRPTIGTHSLGESQNGYPRAENAEDCWQFCIFIVAVPANWHGFLITASPVIPAIHQPFVVVFLLSTIIIIY